MYKITYPNDVAWEPNKVILGVKEAAVITYEELTDSKVTNAEKTHRDEIFQSAKVTTAAIFRMLGSFKKAESLTSFTVKNADGSHTLHLPKGITRIVLRKIKGPDSGEK
jgi:hypothetical protein